MNITFIWHDAFIIEYDECTVLTDFWRLPPHCPDKRSLIALINPAKPLYVLISHHHKDHYSPDVFSLASELPDVRFVISSDTARAARKYFDPEGLYRGKNRVSDNLVEVLGPGMEFSDSHLRISAFGSTDIGNSYVISPLTGFDKGMTTFFAGDLNAWTWRDESTEAEVRQAIADCDAVFDTIQDAGHRHFCVALFPVDARIGSGYTDGAEMFLRRFSAGVFVPMHFCLGDDERELVRHEMAAQQFGRYASQSCRYYFRPDPLQSAHIPKPLVQD